MKFQRRILKLFTLFAIVIIVIFTCIYLTVSVMRHNDKIESEIKLLSDVKVQQINDTFRVMESVTTYLLSDQEVLEALTILAANDGPGDNVQKSATDFYFNREATLIRTRLKTYYMLKEFDKIIIFNDENIVISNSPKQNIQTGFKFDEFQWKSQIESSRGRNVIIGLHDDNWDATNDVQVVSLIREIQGQERGYVEVQITKNKFDELLNSDVNDVDYIVKSKSGELIYKTNEDMDTNITSESISGTNGTLMEQHSDEQNYILVTVSHTNVIKSAISEVLPVTILLLLFLLGASFIYIYYASVYLTKPIRQLQGFMEHTELENIKEEIQEPISSDEIRSLYLSYKDVLDRLNTSVIKEKRLSVLQLQSQFDLLQTQVNPHFIYNVLNVISDRGMASDDEVICEICSDLSEMLRFSTNTRRKCATVEEEVDYLKLYLSLLKYRYNDRLTYKISIDERILGEELPKIVLQQLVENSIMHGYDKASKAVNINIVGGFGENGWYIHVIDRGSGISKEQKEHLYNEMQEVRKKLTYDRSNVELEIGGMGIVNTYARLFLLYGERLTFELGEIKSGGTKIIIMVKSEDDYV